MTGALRDIRATPGVFEQPAPLSAIATALFADAARTLAPRSPERDRALVASWMRNAGPMAFLRTGRRLNGCRWQLVADTHTYEELRSQAPLLVVVGSQTETVEWDELEAVVAWISDIIGFGDGDMEIEAVHPHGLDPRLDIELAKDELPALIRALADVLPHGGALAGTRREPEAAQLIRAGADAARTWQTDIEPRVAWRAIRDLIAEPHWSVNIDADGVRWTGLRF